MLIAHVGSTLTKKQFRSRENERISCFALIKKISRDRTSSKGLLRFYALPFCSEDERPRSSAETGAVKS